MRVRASVYTLVILNTDGAGGIPVAASAQPPDTRLEVMAVTSCPACRREPAACLNRRVVGIPSWDSGLCPTSHPDPEPFLPLSSHQTEEREDSIAGSCPERDSRSSQGPADFLLCDPGEWAGWRGQLLSRHSHLAWPLPYLRFPATGTSRPSLGIWD